MAPSDRDPAPKGPVIVLPPDGPGRPARRFRLRPGRVYALLLVLLLLGLALGAGTVWLLVSPGEAPELTAENRRLSEELGSLRQELDAFREKLAQQLKIREPADVPDEDEGVRMAVPIPAPGEEQPRVRVAIFRTKADVVLEGEGLFLEHTAGNITPMRSVRASPQGSGIFVEGVGTLQDGTRVINRLGPIVVGKAEYPGTLELHRDGDALLLVNEVELERYLAGVVSSEVPGSWDLEAKKSQAVAARTYAMMKRADAEGAWHLEATVADQVYSGRAVDATTQAAVTATHGEILTRDGYLVSAFYHSTCGGRTETPRNVWTEVPSHGNSSVECGFCERAPSHTWTADVTTADLLAAAKKAGHSATQILGLHVRSRSESDRVTALELVTDQGTITWSGNHFRELLGWTKVKSTLFEHSVSGNGFRLKGKGFGHGVGLCQWGAQGMARAGSNYRVILDRYYPKSRIERIY